MKKLKQILAMIAIVLILGMYVAAFVFAMMKSEEAGALFRAAIGATILVPVLLYLIFMVAKAVRPSKSSVIDAVVFDVGRVLVTWPWEEYAEKVGIGEEAVRVIKEKVIGASLWDEFDRGSISRAEVLEKCMPLVPGYEEEMRTFVTTVDDSIEVFWYTEDWIRGLKRKGYKVYILSNWSRESHDAVAKKGVMDFVKLTDGAVWSYECHFIKPEKEMYEHLIRKFGLNPSRTVFIDDAEKNVEGARKCGMSAIRFTDYNDTVEKLASVGVRW